MVVIWGLDLHEMQWWKFQSSYMFSTAYYLRREKMIVYQIAMIFCVISESVGTAALSNYVDQQEFIQNLNNLAAVYNDDFVGIASYNIFVGIYVATIFGSGFFFDLFWPERYESPAVRLAWKICALLAVLFCLSAALTLTIIVATKSSYITGVDAATALELLRQYSKPPLIYRHNAKAVVSVVFLWIGLAGTIGSTFLLFKCHYHDDKMIKHISTPEEAAAEKHPAKLQKRRPSAPTSA